MKRWIVWLAVITLVIFLLLCAGFDLPPLAVAAYLCVAWVQFLGRVAPQIQISWGGVLTGIAALVGTLWMGHMLARWLFRETTSRAWRVRWTIVGVTIIVLMFTAGIGAVGVTHQTVWLAKSPEPLFRSGRGIYNRMRCASHLRQIDVLLRLYASENNGRFPDDFGALIRTINPQAGIFVCPNAIDEMAVGATKEEIASDLLHGHCSYVYHGRGLTTSVPATRPIACEPLANHDGAGINILFADGHVEWFTPSEAQKIMRRITE